MRSRNPNPDKFPTLLIGFGVRPTFPDLYRRRPGNRLASAYGVGIVGYLSGLFLSTRLDMPAGAGIACSERCRLST